MASIYANELIFCVYVDSLVNSSACTVRDNSRASVGLSRVRPRHGQINFLRALFRPSSSPISAKNEGTAICKLNVILIFPSSSPLLIYYRYRSFEEVEEGDLGRVIKLDRDGLHELNVQAEWERKSGPYWLRYSFVEIVGFDYPSRMAASIAAASAAAAAATAGVRGAVIEAAAAETAGSDPSGASSVAAAAAASSSQNLVRVGDRVRVRNSVKMPKYKWGSVTHGAVGVVKAISPNGQDLTIDFPQVHLYAVTVVFCLIRD